MPDALHVSKRRDRDPLPPASTSGPVAQAMPNHLAQAANTMTTNATVTNSQSYAPGFANHGFANHGFANHGFPSFSAPAFPMSPYPMQNYPMPAMYAQPYGYPFAPQGATQAMQLNGFPAHPLLMQNYPPIPNYPMPAPIYAPPSGYPFAMPPPQGSNLDRDYGRKRQYSVSDYPANSDPLDEAGIPNTDPSAGPVGEWITNQETPESWSESGCEGLNTDWTRNWTLHLCRWHFISKFIIDFYYSIFNYQNFLYITHYTLLSSIFG
jgi:hypothetical protein